MGAVLDTSFFALGYSGSQTLYSELFFVTLPRLIFFLFHIFHSYLILFFSLLLLSLLLFAQRDVVQGFGFDGCVGVGRFYRIILWPEYI